LTENSPRFSIKNRWLVDSATSKHISNDRSLFVEFKQTNGTLKVGDTTTQLHGNGKVQLKTIGRSGKPVTLTLHDVEYSPGFHCNLISVGLMKKRGYKADFDKLTIVNKATGKTFSKLEELGNFFALPQVDFAFPAAFATTSFNTGRSMQTTSLRRSMQPLTSKASATRWHQRLGHLHGERVERLAGMVEGMEITPSQITPSQITPSPSNEPGLITVERGYRGQMIQDEMNRYYNSSR
jgi:hypothetical protein